MTSSVARDSVEAEPVEQPSPAASKVSTLTDPWSEDEDDDDDDDGVRNSLELVSAPKELAHDAVAADEDDEEGFDLVNSRDLRSPSPVSLVSTSSRDLVPNAPSPQPTTVTSSFSEAEDLVKVPRQDEPEGAARMQPDTDAELWRSSSSASDCSASTGGRTTTTTKSSASASGSESSRSHDDSADDHTGAMRLSFPDPIAASLSGHEPTAHDPISDVPRGLGSDYSMLLDVTEAASADSTNSQASSASSAASVPASPLSDTSRQLSNMSISPDKQAGALSSPSSSALSSSGANSSDQVVDDEMVSRSTSPLLMTTSTPPSPPSPQLYRKQHQRRRRSSSPTPLSRSDTSSAKQSLLGEQPYALDHDHDHEQQQQQYGKSYDPAHVHDWIRSAAEASSPFSSPKPKSDEEEQEEAASEADSLEQVPCAKDQAEEPPADVEESMQHLQGGEAARQQQQQPEQEPAEHDMTTSLAGPQSMTSSSATVVPAGGMAKKVLVADESRPGAMPASRGVSVDEAQAPEEEEGDPASSSSMQAYAHAPGTARSRKAVAVLSFVAAAVAIAATGWLDSTSSSSPAPVRTLPSPASPAMNCNAAATTTEEVMMTFSETIRALMMETMVAGSEAEAGAGATLITAMSIVRSDYDDHDHDDDDDDDQALSVAPESSCSCRAGSDQQPSAAIDTPPAPAAAQVQEEDAPRPPALPEHPRGVFAPGTKLSELEELVVSRAQRRMQRHRQRRRGSLRRRRRELLSLFDRAAAPVVHAPNPPVMYVPPAVDGPKRRRQVTAPVEVAAAADNSAGSERGHESSWLSAWLQPSHLVARVSTNLLAPSLKHSRHALESANHGRRKLARHLERDVATVAKALQRQRERVHDFAARHRATCTRSPHLPECFLERLGHRSQRGAKSWWDSIRSHVGGSKDQDEVPRSWLDLIKRGRRRAENTRALDCTYARMAPFLARQLETLRLGTRRAQPLSYRGGQETVNHARKAVQALKRVEERFSAWRRGETSRDGRRRKKNKTKNRSRRS